MGVSGDETGDKPRTHDPRWEKDHWEADASERGSALFVWASLCYVSFPVPSIVQTPFETHL